MARPELVDSIVACPKCQSMVQLSVPTSDDAEQLPQPPVALGRDPVDSGAVTEESIAELKLGDKEPTQTPRGFTDSPDPPPQVPTDAESPSWQSAGSARSKKFALLAAIGLASLISLGILASVLLRGVDPEPMAQNESTDSSEQPVANQVDPNKSTPESEAADPGVEQVEPATEPETTDTSRFDIHGGHVSASGSWASTRSGTGRLAA